MWKQVPGGLFGTYVEATVPDGSGVGGRLQELFQLLDTPVEKRPTTLSQRLVDFPYINGGLFKEQLPIFAFTASMREALVRTTEYDWSKISPAIFGSMFQTVKSKDERRSLGEHYTSEANILKVIRPLFLDDFTDKLQKAWESVPNLKRLQAELASKNYLDPACGSGNFLVVTYRRLRNLELKLVARLQELQGKVGDVYLDGRMGLSVTLSQFHGIEINEWSSQIATVAMYLADHQANLEMEEITGISPNRFPLTQSANIQHHNALLVDWASVCEISENTFIMGNPPFLGSLMMTPEQRDDTKVIWNNHKKTGLVDFVTNWFIVAGRLVSTRGCEAAFVSTNSITQGEQPSLLWGELSPLGVDISFAHKTF
jgi:type II restriction/modification system DNA methylase subunit YeeA